jgi:hypothetical protein
MKMTAWGDDAPLARSIATAQAIPNLRDLAGAPLNALFE